LYRFVPPIDRVCALDYVFARCHGPVCIHSAHAGLPSSQRTGLARFAPAFVSAKMYLFGFNGAIERIETEVPDVIVVHFFAPLVKQAHRVAKRAKRKP
jgi:hypothetical protein